MIICLSPVILWAQDSGDVDTASPIGVFVGGKGGLVIATARGTFPSIVFDSSARGSGEVSAANAESGMGWRFTVASLIPFSTRVGLGLEIGVMRSSARYTATQTQAATRLDVFSSLFEFNVEGNVLFNREAFNTSGLRTVGVNAGFEFHLGTIANRIESTRFRDTVGEGEPTAGTFGGGDPFRKLTLLKGAVVARYGLTTRLELSLEGAYAYALHSYFSKDALIDNDFTIDHLAATLAVGYRF
jgi:hypothetical protein